MNPLIVAPMRDLLEEAPVRVTLAYHDRSNKDVRVSSELMALTTSGRALLVGGTRGAHPRDLPAPVLKGTNSGGGSVGLPPPADPPPSHSATIRLG